MSILLIGGDKLGNITDKLKESGFQKIEHVSGRKHSDKKIKIPEKTDLVLVFVDYVGHRLATLVKEESRRNDIKVVFSKRSWVHMENVIQECVKEFGNARKNMVQA